MPLKKQPNEANEIAIYDEALIYQRGEYWQMRMWLAKEKKYARFSLRTRNRDTAEAKAKKQYHELMAQQLAGKTYFSMTAKQAVDEYLKQRTKDMEAGLIVKGRLGTIKTHLEHWLKFIGKDTKVKEMERTDCENYFHNRTKNKKKLPVSRTTVLNEQSSINAMMSWLHKRGESYIEAFEFKKLGKIDTGDERTRRNTFTDEEIVAIKTELEKYIKEAKEDLSLYGNLNKVVTSYYLLISIITGLRRGEQLQLTWSDISWIEKQVKSENNEDEEGETYSLVRITVRGKTSKVGKTRNFVVKDWEYFDELFKFLHPRYLKATKGVKNATPFGKTLIFSLDGKTPLTPRVILYHFSEILTRCEIDGGDERDIVPYSFRHYFITDMINKGASPTQVAETCGTSTAQIEKTYYHTTERKMIENALPQFYYKDDLLIPK
uniref:tyrosine-type recombinase/integrase n=1 Tax=Orrella sp. TaxID=1921583 RepID=UPI0040484AB0